VTEVPVKGTRYHARVTTAVAAIVPPGIGPYRALNDAHRR